MLMLLLIHIMGKPFGGSKSQTVFKMESIFSSKYEEEDRMLHASSGSPLPRNGTVDTHTRTHARARAHAHAHAHTQSYVLTPKIAFCQQFRVRSATLQS